MALTDTNQHGAAYEFGVEASDVPTISGFTARGFTPEYEPEVMATATNGEAHVEAVSISKPAKRMIGVTLVGYISSSFDEATLANTFTFRSRFFFIKKISEPRKKGEYVEVSIEATSFAGVTG